MPPIRQVQQFQARNTDLTEKATGRITLAPHAGQHGRLETRIIQESASAAGYNHPRDAPS